MQEVSLQAEQQKELLPLIQQLPFFSSLSEDRLEIVLQKAKYFSIEPEDCLLQQGQPSTGFFFVLSGQASAFLTHADGQQILIGHLEAGESIGEMGVLLEQPRSATILALSPMQVLWFDAEDFLRLLEEVPSLALSVARFLATRLANSLDLLAERSIENALIYDSLAQAQASSSVSESPHFASSEPLPSSAPAYPAYPPSSHLHVYYQPTIIYSSSDPALSPWEVK